MMLAALLFGAQAQASPLQSGRDLHVVKNAKELGADGSLERPFASPQQAADYIAAVDDAPAARTVWIHSGVYYGSLVLDHPALSKSTWAGAAGEEAPTMSGGIPVPRERFKPWPNRTGVLVASLEGLNATDFGGMMSAGCVNDCQHDKVGLAYGDRTMTLARWPNRAGNESSKWVWANAAQTSVLTAALDINLTATPDAKRVLNWAREGEPYAHGYWKYDWCDSFLSISNITMKDETTVRIAFDDAGVTVGANARWMGVNLLSELDAPEEYFIDAESSTLYFYPPAPLSESSPPIVLTYQAGAVVNVTNQTFEITLANMSVIQGRDAGIVSAGARALTVDGVSVSAHGTIGISVTDSTDSTIRNSDVFDIGCVGIRATGGDAATLTPGRLVVEDNRVQQYALWKRTYQAGIAWGGVNNTYRRNAVSNGPHNCFLGGGNEADGVDCLFENNSISDCAFESSDTGAFYSCGQQGTAFVNRGNVLRGNSFLRIRNTVGTGVQPPGVQALYLDDQMSGWLIENNSFVDCQTGALIGGGRRNMVRNNRYERCDLAIHFDNRGMNWQKSSSNCTGNAPPFQTTCNPAAVNWTLTNAPAASEWASRFPELQNISQRLTEPAFNDFRDNTFCKTGKFMDSSPEDVANWGSTLENNVETKDC